MNENLTSEMKVSIIIPMYNAEKFIRQTLECALNQTYPFLEIIIVDDGSSDASIAIVSEYLSDKVKLVCQPNGGASVARNTGLVHATGEYIQYLDADDLLSPDKIANQMALAKLNSYNSHLLFYCYGVFFEQDIHACTHANAFKEEHYTKPVDLLVDLFTQHKAIWVHAYLTPRFLIEQAGGWNPSCFPNDDGEFFSRVIMSSSSVIYDDTSLVYYRYTPSTYSKVRSAKNTQNELYSLELTVERILLVDTSAKAIAACNRIFNWYIVDWFPENCFLLKRVEQSMIKFGLTYYTSSTNKIYGFLVYLLGWRKAFLLSDWIGKIKRKLFKKHG